MSSINALPNYIEYYDLPDKGAASTGIVFAIWQIGQMVGSLFTWLSDWRGRKFMILLGTYACYLFFTRHHIYTRSDITVL